MVDGEWELDGGGVRQVDPGYDRLLAIGDVNWTDYEVTVPITVNAIDPSGFQSGESGNGAGLGLLFRWNGHTDTPVTGFQPKAGYLPFGAIGWYWWNNPNSARFRLEGNYQQILAEGSGTTPPSLGETFYLKMRVETVDGVGGYYRLKRWPAGQPEPAGWELSGQEGLADPQSGSFLLLAHHVDATFGDVVVTPLGNSTATLDTSVVGSGSLAADPDLPEYSYGETVTLTATPDPGWVFTGWSGDLTGSENPTTAGCRRLEAGDCELRGRERAAGGVWCVGVVVCGFGGGVVVDGQAGDEFGGVR